MNLFPARCIPVSPFGYLHDEEPEIGMKLFYLYGILLFNPYDVVFILIKNLYLCYDIWKQNVLDTLWYIA